MRDALDEYMAYERRLVEEAKHRPKCYWCGAVIWEGKALRDPWINKLLCRDCIEAHAEYIDDDYDEFYWRDGYDKQ